jgi:hypothetical protein
MDGDVAKRNRHGWHGHGRASSQLILLRMLAASGVHASVRCADFAASRHCGLRKRGFVASA